MTTQCHVLDRGKRTLYRRFNSQRVVRHFMVEKNRCVSLTADGNCGRKIPRIRTGVSTGYVMQCIGVRPLGCRHMTLHSCL